MRLNPAAAVVLLPVLLIPSAAAGWLDEFAAHWKVSREFTLAVAALMPEEGYASRPNPEEMTFGELMIHIGDANWRNFALIAGEKAPPAPKASDKTTALKYLADSFEYCRKVAAALREPDLERPTGPRRNMTARERIWAYFTHTAHHRGQAEVYLRVKGIKPPEYRF